jgi:uncharacterized protein YigE (DUF2233 family)
MRRPILRLAPLALALFLTGCAGIAQSIRNEPCVLDPREPYTVVEAVPGQHEIRLFWLDPAGEPFLTLESVRRHVEAAGDSLVMATNAGIYEPGFIPTGLHLEEGRILQPLNTDDGAGNFFLLPNGVFYVASGDAAGVVATDEWPAVEGARLATQSGPLMLREGRMHPRFREGSDSCRLRSGVGVREDGAVIFAISNGAVNFHDFARHFRDALGTPDALYLDGGRSRMLLPAGGRIEDGRFAGILAVVVPRQPGG